MENHTFKGLKLAPQTDKLEEKLMSNDLQHIVNKAYDNYSEKPYIVENAKLYRFSIGGSIFGGLLSICAAFLFVLNLFTQIIVGQIVSKVESIVLLVVLGVLALAFLLLLEYAKSLLISATAKDYQKKGKASIFAILSLLVCLGFSAYTSIQGANSLAILNAQPDDSQLIKVDSVGNNYDAQIKGLNAQIAAAKKNGSGYTWNGALTEKGRNYTERLNNQIMKLNDLRDKNVESSKKENADLLSQAGEKGAYNGAIIMLISAFIELLIIATIIYKERYEFVSLQEIGMLNKGDNVANNEPKGSEKPTINDLTTAANNGKKAITSEQKKPVEIGFHTIANTQKQVVNNENDLKVHEQALKGTKEAVFQVVHNDLKGNEQALKGTKEAIVQVVNNDLNTQVVNNELQVQVVNNDLAAHHKNCLCCGNVFEVKNKIHKFCSNECRYEYNENLKGYKVAQIIAKRK